MTAVILILVAEPREDWEQVTTSESPSRGGSAAKEVNPVPTILPAKHGYSHKTSQLTMAASMIR